MIYAIIVQSKPVTIRRWTIINLFWNQNQTLFKQMFCSTAAFGFFVTPTSAFHSYLSFYYFTYSIHVYFPFLLAFTSNINAVQRHFVTFILLQDFNTLLARRSIWAPALVNLFVDPNIVLNGFATVPALDNSQTSLNVSAYIWMAQSCCKGMKCGVDMEGMCSGATCEEAESFSSPYLFQVGEDLPAVPGKCCPLSCTPVTGKAWACDPGS